MSEIQIVKDTTLSFQKTFFFLGLPYLGLLLLQTEKSKLKK